MSIYKDLLEKKKTLSVTGLGYGSDRFRYFGIKASKSCFEESEPNHQMRVGEQEADIKGTI